MSLSDEQKLTILKQMLRVRSAAHMYFFAHRRRNIIPPAHYDIIRAWHSRVPRLITEAFRGCAKSTLSEEGVILAGAFRECHNVLIVSSNEERAKDRLSAIRHEMETNERFIAVFGDLLDGEDTATAITIKGDIRIQALGQGQDLRGIKHHDWRPDLVVVDDLERKSDTLTPGLRQRTRQWFIGELIPALDPSARIRFNGTPLDPESLLPILKALPGWTTQTFPVKYRDANTGEWKPTWEDRFPLHEVDRLEKEFIAIGEYDTFLREYMCQATADELRAFKPEYFVTKALPRTYEATYAIYDPARSIKDTSAHTGYVVYSWKSNKLIVWESGGQFWLPSDIIADISRVEDTYNPIFIGVEKDGLEEFIMQPLRQEGLKRQNPLPIKALKAPRGKLDFIRGLEPFFRAKEVIFSGDTHTLLREQLLSFPSGRIDIPNALAYALRLRPGLPIYEDFTSEHVEPCRPHPREPIHLCLNVANGVTSLVAVQLVKGRLLILHDAMAEGDPGAVLADMVTSVALAFPARPFRFVAPAEVQADYDRTGLRAAVRALPAALHRGGDAHKGRNSLRDLLRSQRGGVPLVAADPGATFVLRALAGGYAFPLRADGPLAAAPEPNAYATLMQGVECFLGLTGMMFSAEDHTEEQKRYAVTEDGRRYLSARG